MTFRPHQIDKQKGQNVSRNSRQCGPWLGREGRISVAFPFSESTWINSSWQVAITEEEGLKI